MFLIVANTEGSFGDRSFEKVGIVFLLYTQVYKSLLYEIFINKMVCIKQPFWFV